MNLLQPPVPATDPLRLDQEITRTAEFLRSFSAVRLAAPLIDGRSRAQLVRALAQSLTDRAATLAGRPRRVLPELPDRASGDVLAVCAHDLLEQVRAVGARDECGRAVADLITLRQIL